MQSTKESPTFLPRRRRQAACLPASQGGGGVQPACLPSGCMPRRQAQQQYVYVSLRPKSQKGKSVFLGAKYRGILEKRQNTHNGKKIK
jgi:hypothetical protein